MSEASPWGMVVHNADERLIDLLYQGGVSWLRVTIDWSLAQPKQGGPIDWQQAIDFVGRAAKRGMKVLLGVEGTPEWAYDRQKCPPQMPRHNTCPPQLPLWEAFVASVAAKFAPLGVTHFGVWNEPNGLEFFHGTRATYVELLRSAHRVIKELPGTQGRLQVCGPELASAHDPYGWLADVLDGMRDRRLDVVTVHSYSSDNDPGEMEQQLRRHREVMRAHGYGDAPLWLTEVGFSQKTPEPRNAAAVGKLCDAIRAGAAAKVFYYVWTDDPPAHKYAWLYGYPSHLEPGAKWDAYRAKTGESHPGVPLELDARTEALSIPAQLRPGEAATAKVTMVNVGEKPWERGWALRSLDGPPPHGIAASAVLNEPVPPRDARHDGRHTFDVALGPMTRGSWRVLLQLTVQRPDGSPVVGFGDLIEASVQVGAPPPDPGGDPDKDPRHPRRDPP